MPTNINDTEKLADGKPSATEQEVLDALGGRDSKIMDSMAELAGDFVAELADFNIKTQSLKDQKKELDSMREQLATLMFDNQCGSDSGHKFDNGILLKASRTQQFTKAAGVTEEELFDFLKDRNLDGIIKPVIHWKTLSSTMVAELALGNEVPESMFKKKIILSVSPAGNGHIKFLQERSSHE